MWRRRPVRVGSLVFVDIETTGLRPDRGARITEVAVVDARGVRYRWEREAGGEKPPPVAPEVLRAWLEHLRGGVVVGHNLRFDLGFVAYEAEQHGWPMPSLRVVDTLSLARRLGRRGHLPNAVNDYRLGTLLGAFSVTPAGPLHTAVVDAEATRALFWKMVEAGEIDTLAEAGAKRLLWSTS